MQVFQNPGAAYLAGGASSIPSPLNIGIENSRRFRALPVYANLIRYGRKGYQEMLTRQIKLARRIAQFIQEHEKYELLPPFANSNKSEKHVIDTNKQIDNTFVILCFRAVEEGRNRYLADRIKATREMYVSGTKFWDGRPAVRIAVCQQFHLEFHGYSPCEQVSNWQANEEEDFEYIKQVLNTVC